MLELRPNLVPLHWCMLQPHRFLCRFERHTAEAQADDNEEEANEANGSEGEDDVPVRVLFRDHGPGCVQCGTQEEGNPKKGSILICDYGFGKDKKCDAGWHMGCIGLKLIPPKRERWFCPDHATLINFLTACRTGCNCTNCTVPSDSNKRKRKHIT